MPLSILLALAPVFITADVPFRAQWGPLADTVNYRVMIDGEQIGADWPKNLFPTDVNWVFTHAQVGMHTFEVLSINSTGQSTPVPVTINGQKPSPGLIAPTSPKLRHIIYVEPASRSNPVLP